MSAPVAALRVLLVDDDARVRETVCRFLSRRGHDVHTAANGEEAVRAITAGATHVVLLDLRLGADDGVDVGRRLLEHHPGLLVIALTAYAMDEKAGDLVKAGFFDCLAKPVEPDTLLEVLARAAAHLGLEASEQPG
jgi:DNA-binding NtrC family response regulator